MKPELKFFISCSQLSQCGRGLSNIRGPRCLSATFLLLLLLSVTACGQSEPTPTITPQPSGTSSPSKAMTQTSIPLPTATPLPPGSPTPPSAEMLLLAALDASEEAGTFSMNGDMKINMATEGLTIEIPVDIQMDIQLPDRQFEQSKLDAQGQSIQFQRILIGDEVYIRELETENWDRLLGSVVEQEAITLNTAGILGRDVLDILGNDLSNIRFSGEANLAGTEVFQIQAEITPNKVSPVFLNDNNFWTIDIYLDRASFLPIRLESGGSINAQEIGLLPAQQLEMLQEMETEVIFKLDFADFGQPFTIEAPQTNTGIYPHLTSLSDVAYSPDGQTLAVSSGDNSVYLWDLTEAAAESSPRLLQDHRDWVMALTFSPDGRYLASGGADHRVLLWDLKDPSAEPIEFTGHEDWIRDLAFSPDGGLLASTGDDGVILVWNLVELETDSDPSLLLGHDGFVFALDFNPQGDILASAGQDGVLNLWNVADLTVRPLPIIADGSVLVALAFHPKEAQLAVGGEQGSIFLYDLENLENEPLFVGQHTGDIETLEFSPDGTILASAGEWGEVYLWDMSGNVIRSAELPGYSTWVNSLAFSPDGRQLAAAGDDGTARLWSIEYVTFQQGTSATTLNAACSDPFGCLVINQLSPNS